MAPRMLALFLGAGLIGVAVSFGVARAIRAGSGAVSDARLVVELQSDTPSMAQVYFDTGAGFTEPESAQAAVAAGGVRTLLFAVRSPVLRAMRLDPLRCGGTVDILGWRLESADGRGRLGLPVDALRPAYQIASAEMHDGRLHVVIPAGAEDPQLLFAPASPVRVPAQSVPWRGLLLGCAGLGLIVAGRAAWRDALPGLPAWAVVLALAVAGGYLLYPVHRVLDYPLWDEANYLGWGRAAWTSHDLGGVSGSPVYLAWYAVITSWFSGATPVFVTHYVLKIAAVVLTGVLAARWFESRWAGLCAGLAAAVSAWSLTFPLLVYQAAWLWFLLAILAADRSRVGAIGFLALAALTRLEYAFALGAFVALAAGAAVRHRLRQRTGRIAWRIAWAWCLPLLGAAVIAGHVHGWNPGTSRSWFAFQQHYALGRVESGRDQGVDPMIEYDRLIGRDFPGAKSLRQAYAINPTGVQGHVLRNLSLVPRRLAGFFSADFGGVSGMWIGLGGLALAIAVAVFTGSSDSAGIGAFLRSRRWSVVCAASGCAAVIPGLVIYAKTAYLLPVVPLVWLVAALLAGLVRGLRARGGRMRAVHGAVLVGGLAAGLAAVPRPYAGVAAARPVADAVATIRALRPAGASILGVSASSYAHYLGPRYRGIEPLGSVSGNAGAPELTVGELVRRHHPDLVLVTPQWSSLRSFDPDGLRALESDGWRRVPLSDGALYLAPESSPAHP